MSHWFYDKKDFKSTPTIADGITYETEQRYRREGARFIINMGNKLNLQYDTIATGIVYFHRFYMIHSFKTFPRYVTACCCLFLAGKVEETPKKCKDIIKTARSQLNDSQFAQFGDDPKEEVMTLEKILLQTIKFDLQVEHPYAHLLKYIKCLKGDKAKVHKILQMAWTFINDSLCTTLSLQWEPEITAIALMYLAGKLSKFEVTDWIGRTSKHSHWWDMFVIDLDTELLEDICHQVLDLYQLPPADNAQDSPPQSPALPLTPTTTSAPAPPVAAVPTIALAPPPKPQYFPTSLPQLPPSYKNFASPKVSVVNSPAKLPPPVVPKVPEGLPIPKVGEEPLVKQVATPPHPIPVISSNSTEHPPLPPMMESYAPPPLPPKTEEPLHPPGYLHTLPPTEGASSTPVFTPGSYLPSTFPPLPAEKPQPTILVQPPPPPLRQSTYYPPAAEPPQSSYYSHYPPPPPPPSQPPPPPPPSASQSTYHFHEYHHLPPPTPRTAPSAAAAGGQFNFNYHHTPPPYYGNARVPPPHHAQRHY